MAQHTQHELIIEHFRSGKTLSQMEATGLYRISRLASRVDELRKQGWPILTEMREDRTGRRYARYSLVTDGMQLPAKYQPTRLAVTA